MRTRRHGPRSAPPWKRGEVLGYVEAMGVLNDVEASCAGLVGEIAVEDGQPVEYGQPLFVLRAEDQRRNRTHQPSESGYGHDCGAHGDRPRPHG